MKGRTQGRTQGWEAEERSQEGTDRNRTGAVE